MLTEGVEDASTAMYELKFMFGLKGTLPQFPAAIRGFQNTLLFSFASLSRIENISIISNNAKTTVSGGSRQQSSSLLQNSE